MSRTLARRADSLLAGLGPEMAETARQVFLRLVSVDDDSNAVGTRRRALVVEVEELDQPGRVRRLLDTFGRHRLLTFDRDPVTRGPTVEISHEALLTEWTTLRTWIDDARDDLRMHRQLVAEMNAWTAADRSPDYLLRGGRLDAHRRVGRDDDDRAATGRARVPRGQPRPRAPRSSACGRRRSDARPRRSAGPGDAPASSCSPRPWSRRVVALATFAWAQRQDARRSEADLTANQAGQRLATLSVNSLSTDPELALLLAKEAVSATADRGYALPEAIDAVHWALQELGVQYDVTTDTPVAARSGPGGVRGVWALPVDELMSLADAAVARDLTADECRRYVGSSGCRAPVSMAGIEYLGGTDAYADAVALDQAEVVIGVRTTRTTAGEFQANLDAIGEKYGLRVRLQRVPFQLTPLEAAAQGTEADVYVLTGPDDRRGRRRPPLARRSGLHRRGAA